MLDSVDCSNYIRDIYKCFGLSLARNTTWQSAMPVYKYDVASSTDEEKKASRTSLNFDTREVVDNTNRFKLSALFKRNKERKYVDMRTNSITYPYWENEARFEEQRQIKVYRFCLVLLIIPVISLIYICLCVKKRVDKVWDGVMRKVRPKHS